MKEKTARGVMGTAISIGAFLLIGYLGLGAILYFMQPVLTYKPTKQVLYTPQQIGLDFEQVRLKTPDGLKLSGWFVPADDGSLTVMMCHGNGGNIAHRLDTINIFNELGLNCLIFDYRGYGQSQGKPTEEGTYKDAQTAYNWLTRQKRISPEKIIIFGRSLGGSIAAHLAKDVQCKGVMLESCFTSYADIGQKFYPYLMVRPFARFGYNTDEYLQQINCPVLLVHSRGDEIVPFEFGLQLYEDAANEPKHFVEIYGSHNDGFLYSGKIYRDGLKNWLEFVKQYQPGKIEVLP